MFCFYLLNSLFFIQFHHKSVAHLLPSPPFHLARIHTQFFTPPFPDAKGHKCPVFHQFSPFHMALPWDQHAFYPLAIWSTSVFHEMFLGLQRESYAPDDPPVFCNCITAYAVWTMLNNSCVLEP